MLHSGDFNNLTPGITYGLYYSAVVNRPSAYSFGTYLSIGKDNGWIQFVGTSDLTHLFARHKYPYGNIWSDWKVVI